MSNNLVIILLVVSTDPQVKGLVTQDCPHSCPSDINPKFHYSWPTGYKFRSSHDPLTSQVQEFPRMTHGIQESALLDVTGLL